MRFRWPLALLLATACADPDPDPPPVSPDPMCDPETHLRLGYLKKSELPLDGEWYYRRTIVDSGGTFEGIGDLSRVQLSLEDERMVLVRGSEELAEWAIEHIDLVCAIDGTEARLVIDTQRPIAEREYVRFQGPRVSSMITLSPRAGWQATFTPDGELLDRRRVRPDHLDFLEDGSLEVAPAACESFFGPLSAPTACGGVARLRHVLIPAIDVGHSPLTADRFELYTTGGFAERFDPASPIVFHLAADFPDEPDAIAAVAAQLSAVLPSFSIERNTCRTDEIARAIESPALFEAAELELCDAPACDDPLSNLAPARLADVCHALERTDPLAFTWQRPGDLRFNVISWLRFESPSGWGAHTVRAVDPIDARIVAADLFLDGGSIDAIANDVKRHVDDGDPAPEALVALAQNRAQSAASERLPVSRMDLARIAALGALDRSPDAMLPRIALAEGTGAGEERSFPILLEGPNGPGVWPVAPELLPYASPQHRIELLLDAAGRSAVAELSEAGYSFLRRRSFPAAVAIAATLGALDPDEAGTLARRGLVTHALLHGLLHALGLADNPAASFDALNFPDEVWSASPANRHLLTSSVMDLIPLEERPFVTALGRYDVAALRYLYRQEVEVLSEPLLGDPGLVDYTRIPELMPGTRSFVPLDPTAPPPNEVPYRSCRAEDGLVRPTYACAADDWGGNARETFAHAYARWLGHYHSLNVVDDADAFDPTSPARAAIAAFERASIALQHAGHLARTDLARFEGSDLARDLITAAVAAGNLALEIVGTPASGSLCAWRGTNPTIFVPAIYTECAPDERIEPPLGIARDSVFGDRTEGAPWERVGVYFDQVNALWAIALAFPTDLPSSASRIAVSDLITNEVDELHARLLAVPPYWLRAQSIEALGHWWCRDPESPNDLRRGHAQPRMMIDVASGVSFPGPPEFGCDTPSFLMPTEGSLTPQLLFYNRALEVGPLVQIYLVGSDGATIDWTAIDPTDRCSFTDLDGVEYRAIWSESPLGCQLLEMAADAAARASMVPGSLNADYEWFEARVEEARALSLLYPR